VKLTFNRQQQCEYYKNNEAITQKQENSINQH
jgi:hypothetical protein